MPQFRLLKIMIITSISPIFVSCFTHTRTTEKKTSVTAAIDHFFEGATKRNAKNIVETTAAILILYDCLIDIDCMGI